jgi:hypothetical protein
MHVVPFGHFSDVAKEIRKYASLLPSGASGDKERFVAAIFLNETPISEGRFQIQDGAAGEKGIGQVMPVWWAKFPENDPGKLSDQVRISCQVMKDKAAWLRSKGYSANVSTEQGRENLARMYNGGAGNFQNCPANPGKTVCQHITAYAERLERNWEKRALEVLSAPELKSPFSMPSEGKWLTVGLLAAAGFFLLGKLK